jgi:hypothetical protein
MRSGPESERQKEAGRGPDRGLGFTILLRFLIRYTVETSHPK